MQTILISLHVLFALAIVALVLLQRAEGGGLGFGGSGMQGLMSARGKASLMTRATATAAALFFASSLALSILVSGGGERASIAEGHRRRGRGRRPGSQRPGRVAPSRFA